jgi:wobble nucleotide-excising tRNase
LIINLSREDVFVENEIKFDKKINFIFGKNGTGKSTIAKLIKEQIHDYDTRIFQGFEGIVDENKRLNAVVLGEENASINQKIEEKTDTIESLSKQREAVLRMITKPVDGVGNFWTKHEVTKSNYAIKDNDIREFKTTAAAKIKNEKNPQISDATYTAPKFSDEISKAKLIQDAQIKTYKEILRSEAKVANNIQFPIIDFSNDLASVNEILESKVKEKTRINRLEGNEEKRKFAESGLKCHQQGDVCSFCGNRINDDVFLELESYFSADEVKAFQDNITLRLKELDQLRQAFNNIHIGSENFYPELHERVNIIKLNSEELFEAYEGFIQYLSKSLQEKQSNLFVEGEKLILEIPPSFASIQTEYDELVEANNKKDLAQRQNEAREKLRFHNIKTLLDEYKYDVQINELSHLDTEKNRTLADLNAEKEKIEGINGFDNKIRSLREEINILRNETKDEKKLAQIISNKLKHFVSFELDHCDNEGEVGFYRVKCLRTNTVRDITQLSTGEKNIIAFLYFIEKLNEIRENQVGQNKKLIVFDDPMNSNDDTMQYMIIDAFQNLMKKIQSDDKMIILTHNNHFYLNVKYGRKYIDDKKSKADKFIRFVSNGTTTAFKNITTEKDDFKTNYEALWKDARYLYDEEKASPEMILNPIRRIIETYTKFNMIDKTKFYENQSGAKKLFDVNSHSIDDFEADLNGKTKDDIVLLFKGCFKDINSEEHFCKYWKTE